MNESEIASGSAAGSLRPDRLRLASVVVILALTIGANHGLRDGALRLAEAATAQLLSDAEHRIELTTPRSGEIALTEPVLRTIEMLRANAVDRFRLSTEVGGKEFVRQRLIEGAWPIRFDEAAGFLVAYQGERTGCVPVDRRDFDPGWRIPRRQAPLFAGRRGVQLVRCP